MGAVAQRRGGIAPGPAAVGGGAAQQRRPVIDLDRTVGFRRATEGDFVRVDDHIAGDRGRRRHVGIHGHAQRARGHAGGAGHVGGGGGQVVGGIRQGAGGVAPGPAAVGGGVAQQRRAVIDLDRAVGFRRAGQRQDIHIGDAVAHHATVGRERDDRGRRRHVGIHGHAQRARGHAGGAGHVGGGGGQVVGGTRQGAGGVAPGPAAVGGGVAQQRRAVIDLDRAVGDGGASQRQDIHIGDAVAHHATVGRERDDRGRRRHVGIHGHAQRARGHAGGAGHVGGGGGQAVGAVAQRRGGEAPGPAAVGGGAAQQRRSVIDLDRAVGFRRAGQHRRIVVGDVVTHDAAVDRERDDRRRRRHVGIHGHAQRARGHAGDSGHRIRRGEAVGGTRQGAGGVAPGPAAVGGGAAQQRRAVINLDRAVGIRRAGQRQDIHIGDAVAHRAAVGRERGDGGRRRHVGIHGHAQRARGRTGRTRYRIGRREAVASVAQGPGRVAPGSAGIGHRRAEQRGA